MSQEVFQRIEKKYLLTQAQYTALRAALTDHMDQDQYGLHTIANIYYDTDDYALIRASIEKPVYKEKLRVRSYGTPKADDTVFVELKKKFKRVVYKRRIPLALRAADAYLLDNIKPSRCSQILREIDWFRKLYDLSPKAFIAYDRIALANETDCGLRVTFDENIRWRGTQLDLAKGSWGMPLLPEDSMLMEIKIPGAMPVWLAGILSDLRITPTSFSKYGACYKQHLINDFRTTGGLYHAS